MTALFPTNSILSVCSGRRLLTDTYGGIINENKMVVGVCGGIAEYFDIDPTLVRLGWGLFCALGGSGILAYIIAAIVIPRRPEF